MLWVFENKEGGNQTKLSQVLASTSHESDVLTRDIKNDDVGQACSVSLLTGRENAKSTQSESASTLQRTKHQPFNNNGKGGKNGDVYE